MRKKIKGLSRRDFLKWSAVGAFGASTGLAAQAQRPGPLPRTKQLLIDSFKMPETQIGNTGIKSSILGIGTGSSGVNRSSRQTRLGFQNLVNLLEYCYDRGITYFDMADQYGSHPFMKAALKENGGTIPREKVMLLTKTHAATAEDMRRDLDRFRQEAGTDYFDILLLHCETREDWPVIHQGAMEELSRAKEKGIIKAHGVSCHSISALRRAAEEPWVEVDLARYNPWGRVMDADVPTVAEVLKDMKSKGKGVIGMKVLSNGRAVSPDLIRQSIRFSVESPLIDCFTIGMESRQQAEELLVALAEVHTPAAEASG